MAHIVESGLKIIPLGGLGEIGLNMTVFEYGNKIIIVDCGLMFPEDHMLGVDIVIPDFHYLEGRGEDILALILTHGHEDHIGAVSFFMRKFDVPVYGTRLTLALIENKLSEYKQNGVKTHIIHPDSPLSLGDFRIHCVRVAHSIMDGVALGIETPEGFVVHTGDFKLDFSSTGEHATDIRAFARLGDRKVLCLLSDSTNIEQYGYTMSELEVGKKLKDVFRNANGRIIITLFASNVARIQQVFQISEEFGRKVFLSGKSMNSTVAIARRLRYLDLSEAQILKQRNLSRFPKNRTTILTTGSQGEPLSALSRIANGDHKHIKIEQGDTVILSSKFIPGNEGTITWLINKMFKQGAQVVYETISDIHASGHAHKEELRLMLKLIRPKFFIPIHGEMRHLVQHCTLAKDMGVLSENLICAKNGDVIQFLNGNGKIVSSTYTGRVFVDGKGVGDVGNIVLTDRRLLSESGVVTCTIVYDPDSGQIIHPPGIASKGFVYEPDHVELFKELAKHAEDTFSDIYKSCPIDDVEAKEKMSRALRKALYKKIQRRPVIIPVFIPMQLC